MIWLRRFVSLLGLTACAASVLCCAVVCAQTDPGTGHRPSWPIMSAPPRSLEIDLVVPSSESADTAPQLKAVVLAARHKLSMLPCLDLQLPRGVWETARADLRITGVECLERPDALRIARSLGAGAAVLIGLSEGDSHALKVEFVDPQSEAPVAPEALIAWNPEDYREADKKLAVQIATALNLGLRDDDRLMLAQPPDGLPESLDFMVGFFEAEPSQRAGYCRSQEAIAGKSPLAALVYQAVLSIEAQSLRQDMHGPTARVLSWHPDNALVLSRSAQFYAMMGDMECYSTTVTKLRTVYPKLLLADALEAWYPSSATSHERIVELHDRLVESLPNSAILLSSCANYHMNVAKVARGGHFFNLMTEREQDLFREHADLAFRLAEKAAEIEPTSYRAWDVLITVRTETGNREGAEEAFRRATELEPTKAEPYLDAVWLYKPGYGGTSEAMDAFVQKAIAAPIKEPEQLVKIGHMMLDLDRFGNAEQVYRKAIEAKGADYPPAEAGLAAALSRQGKRDEAVKFGRKALEGGDFAAARRALGDCAAFAGNYEEAKEHYAAWASLEPAEPQALWHAARACVRLAEWAETSRLLDACEGLDPKSGMSWAGRIELYESQGDFGKAWEAYRKAVSSTDWPKLGYPASWLGRLALKLGKLDDAEAFFEDQLAQSPEDSLALWGMSLVDVARAAFADAQEHLEKLGESREAYPSLGLLRALIAWLEGEKDIARQMCLAADEARPEMKDFSWLLKQQGWPPQLQADFEAMLNHASAP